MDKRVDSHSEMAQARQSDGLNVIFDQKSPGSSHSRSRSRSVGSSASSRSTGSSYRGRRRSSSSSSSSTSSRSTSSSRSRSRSRSRSYPRCHRRSSRCGCDDHRRYGRGYHRRTPPRRYRAHSRSYSRSPLRRYRARSRSYSRSPPRRYRAQSRSYGRSPSIDKYSRHRKYYRSRSRSRSLSPARWSRYRRPTSQYRCRFSRSPSRTYRGRSRSRSSGRSVSLSLRDKRELLEAAKANAMKLFGVEKLELPESVKPILSEQPELKSTSPEPASRVRQGPLKTVSMENEPEPDISSPRTSPKRKIAFSENNSVAKPTMVAPSSAKVTPRVDSIEGRKPYGHWIPISSAQNSSPHKHI